MESYDQILIGSFYALPAFQKTFGFQTASGSYQVPATWQSALSEDLLPLGHKTPLLLNPDCES